MAQVLSIELHGRFIYFDAGRTLIETRYWTIEDSMPSRLVSKLKQLNRMDCGHSLGIGFR